MYLEYKHIIISTTYSLLATLFYYTYTCTSGIESYILVIVPSLGTVGDTVTMIITCNKLHPGYVSVI